MECSICAMTTIQQPSPLPPHTGSHNREDSSFIILLLNGNGISNKQTVLENVFAQNKVKAAEIQEPKLTPRFRNSCIQDYTTVRSDRTQYQGGGTLIFIHKSITIVSRKPN